MPVETRTLLFDKDELSEAVRDHLVRKGLASVEDRLNTLDVEPDTKGTVVAGLVDGNGASRKLELSYGDVTKALIQYCRAHQIPLPRYGDKQLAPAGDGMALMVRMVFSRPDRPA